MDAPQVGAHTALSTYNTSAAKRSRMLQASEDDSSRGRSSEDGAAQETSADDDSSEDASLKDDRGHETPPGDDSSQDEPLQEDVEGKRRQKQREAKTCARERVSERCRRRFERPKAWPMTRGHVLQIVGPHVPLRAQRPSFAVQLRHLLDHPEWGFPASWLAPPTDFAINVSLAFRWLCIARASLEKNLRKNAFVPLPLPQILPQPATLHTHTHDLLQQTATAKAQQQAHPYLRMLPFTTAQAFYRQLARVRAYRFPPPRQPQPQPQSKPQPQPRPQTRRPACTSLSVLSQEAAQPVPQPNQLTLSEPNVTTPPFSEANAPASVQSLLSPNDSVAVSAQDIDLLLDAVSLMRRQHFVSLSVHYPVPRRPNPTHVNIASPTPSRPETPK